MEDSRILLREKAKAKMPNIPQEPHDFLVAVSSHRKTLEALQPSDFMWFKCRAKHTVAKIRTFYTQKTMCQVDLYSGTGIPADTTQIAWLDHWGDKLITFRAVENEQQAPINSQSPRTPLRPVNGQTTSNSSDTSEKTLKPTIKDDPDKATPPPTYMFPRTDSSTRDSLGAFLGSSLPYGGQNILKNKLQIGQHIGGVVTPAQGFVPPALNAWPSWYGHDRPPPNFKTPSISQLNSTSGYVKQEHPLPFGNSYVSPYKEEPGLSPALDVAHPAAEPIPNASQNKRLAKILAEAHPEVLEAEVQASLNVLDQLKSHLSDLPVQSAEAQQWFQQIENLRKQNINEPTIIGVVGNTGAGKSSVINAMLDEERLVPTNCMRACTAVVTEMSWNPSEDESAKYRAAIEFIQPEEWEKELRVLFGELLDGSGNVSREASNEDSEAGVAYAKIKAVYPQKTREDIAKSNIRDLMQEPAVRNVLGKTKTVEEARSDKFYRILQTYVDSKEKSTDDKKQKKEMEYWPLIKVVKIYTKADALSTGAVVVDLPGVHDSNAARSAIANNYMKMCTGLWIVAPITRAVDDKAAKSLLGESFKRQLKYDGTYSRVTFICSKTDDISITEASDSLGLEEEMLSKWEKFDKIEKDQKRLKKELAELKESKAIFGEVLGDTDDQLEVWDKLREDLEEGKIVYGPTFSSKKRKKSHKSPKQRKRMTSGRNSADDDFIDDEEDDDASDPEESQTDTASQVEPLTSEAVDTKIAELKSTKKEARLQRRELDSQILNLREQLKCLDSAHDEIEAEMSKICISGRNQYSKGAIQQDFAAGIKELDQENQVEANEADFNPDEELRDYAEVAQSLPVFCVSSRAYQKLSGRLQRDKGVPGFSTLEETEIPQLQAHCKKLTEAGRASTCRRFLNAFSQLVNSLTLWASNDGSGIQLSDAQRAAEGRFLQSKLAELEKGLEIAVQGCLEEMKETLSENIYEKFDKVIQAAVDEANATAAKWGAPVNRENRNAGGYFWATYKAICRRDGVYSNAQGLHDFNLQLTEPIIKQLGSDWEKAFARRLPHVLQSFTRSTKALLQSFHQAVQTRAVKSGTGIAGMAMLGQQLQTYEHIFLDLTNQMVTVIGERQRDANREFTPVIARHLLSAYHYCVAESGPGSYMRMKAHMTSYVDQHRQTMFHESTEEVKKHLKQMCGQVEEQMMNKADEVFVLMRRDYMTVITGQHMPHGHIMPKWERSMKAEIAKLIQEREDAADREESPDRGNSDKNMNVGPNKDAPPTPPKAYPGFGASENDLDEDSPAEDLANSIQQTLNEEIKAEFD